jgi:plasmid stabilization system protein ParE
VVIVWSRPARQDLRLIHHYIAHDSKHYATRVAQDITDKVEILRDLPRLGRPVPQIG